MKLTIKRYKDRWYFSKWDFWGLGADRTQAIYDLKKRTLTIVRTKCLGEIFEYLQEHLDITKISVTWYKETRDA